MLKRKVATVTAGVIALSVAFTPSAQADWTIGCSPEKSECQGRIIIKPPAGQDPPVGNPPDPKDPGAKLPKDPKDPKTPILPPWVPPGLCDSTATLPIDKELYDLYCTPAAGEAPPPPSADYLAGIAVARIKFPEAAPSFGPDPQDNQWKMIPIGHPIWLWTEGASTVSSSDSVMGYAITLTARRTSVSFNMGDGTVKSCSTMTPYTRSVAPGTPSPDCGHSYQKRPAAGSYTVTTTATWEVTWSVLGQTGVIPVTQTSSRSLPVGELQAVVVR